MPLKTSPIEDPTINLTSLLDIILFLVMFFMIGAHFSESEQQMDIKVPTAGRATALAGVPDGIVVNISVEGRVTVLGQQKTLDELAAYLKQAQTQYPEQSVIIRGDGHCEYQLVMDALSVCTEAGIRNVSVSYQPRKRQG
jgi:biopolymer transport protein ExbD